MSNVCIPAQVFNELKADHLRRIREEFDRLDYINRADYIAKYNLINLARKFYGDCPEVLQMQKDLI